MFGLNRRRNSKQQIALLAGAGTLSGVAALWAWRKLSPTLSFAPGWPGETPYWNSSAKQVVGTPLDPRGNVWFTLHRGVLTEVFFPRADQPSLNCLKFIVTGPRGFYSDEMEEAEHEVAYLAEGVPAYRIVSRCRQGRYSIEKTLFAHPWQPVVLQEVQFKALKGWMDDYRLHAFVDPHLDNRGWRNTAEVGRHKGREMLLASRAGHAVAVGVSTRWRKASAGFLGTSDGRRQLRHHGELRQVYRRAPRGNVSLIAEIDCHETGGAFVLAAGFGESRDLAGHRVQESLLADTETLRAQYVDQWQSWHSRFAPPEKPQAAADGRDLYHTSTMVLRTHEDKQAPGAFVASLSIPWGEARKANSYFGPVGYHVVWPRDLFMIGGGLLAAGDAGAARRALDYLEATQQERGNWTQNQAVSGRPVWTGKQLGETAMAVLLFDLLNRAGELTAADRRRYWPMVRRAVAHVVQLGPSAQEDRWEDAAGFTPFTLACIISSFLIAAELAEEQGASREATYLRETADAWCTSIEYWTHVRDTELAHRVGVPGYYLRVAPLDRDGAPDKYRGYAQFWYRPAAFKDAISPADVVSPDALAYVRFGLRAADDPRILDTIKVIDETLKVDTPRGPCWYRYIGDGYGEQRDGSPFDGKRGIGRLWPLLTGERAHYELIAGHHDEAARLLTAMEQLAGDGGMIPEQVWDTQDLPERGLYFGRPSGSAMPLAWAHAEYVKLRRSLADGHVFDMPELNRQRYVVEGTESPHVIWGLNHRRPTMPPGKILRIQTDSPTRVTWYVDGKQGGSGTTSDSGLGLHYLDLPT
ncbi:MAG TPA: glycoside hydrolase family 15 protein, partial [Pirellulales bacterium]|nr:glycoside hydrolase family 15 protein [Pirellulales bacterium]